MKANDVSEVRARLRHILHEVEKEATRRKRWDKWLSAALSSGLEGGLGEAVLEGARRFGMRAPAPARKFVWTPARQRALKKARAALARARRAKR